MTSFSIAPRGAFSLRQAADFIAGFPPAGRPDAASSPLLRLAFVTDDLTAHAGVALAERDGVIAGSVTGSAPADAVARQVARILSLDHDGSAFDAVGERDPVVGDLQERHRGLRPVLFHSPYEAAAWSVISARQAAAQALRVKERLMFQLGGVVEVDGEQLASFPLPERLRSLEHMEGLSEEKASRLRGVAEAALDGRLEVDRLRALPADEALEELRTIRGIGPFYAGLILLRAVGVADELPPTEPRVRQAVARAYGLDEPPDHAELERIAEPWRPFRTWVCLLMRVGA